MKICVYCASSARIDSIYFEATKRLAERLVEEKVEVIYGGGATGLMGQLADTILEKGGKIKGIMPKFMNEHTKKSLTLNLLKPCKSEKVSFWRELMAW